MATVRTKLAILISVVLVGTFGLLIYVMLQQAKVSCEACIQFNGRTVCRSAIGPDDASASRTAIDNACGLLAGGMTQSIACTNTPPVSLVCE
ncbi:MAG: hypothetical protein OEV00_07880 [Acidobacteriota bacterium]|nr:hypothetical protein [Acidobacteriota bacterium]MDH3785232.1 hypothetical protein [Acidobacteriota bacterium]